VAETTYFCPECGWEGPDPICAVCGSKTESLNIDPVTGNTTENESSSLDEIEDIGEEWEDEDSDNY
jgi:hypothetical protein